MSVNVNVSMNYKEYVQDFCIFLKIFYKQNLNIQFLFYITFKHINGKYKRNKH